jgi:Spore germination protein.
LHREKKISLRQALLLFIIVISSPSIRILPSYTVGLAAEAGWVAPIIAFVLIIPVVYFMDKVLKRYNDTPITVIINSLVGKVIGSILIVIYIVWFAILVSLYTRYFGAEIVATSYPRDQITIFVFVMLFLIAIIIRSGIVVIARMNEICFGIVVAFYIFLVALLIPNVNIKDLLPVSTMSIVPLLKANAAVMGVWSYMVMLLFTLNDEINNREKMIKQGFQTAVFVTILTTTFIAVTLGTLGHGGTIHAVVPFIISVKSISYLGLIERLDSFFIPITIVSHFFVILMFAYMTLHLIKLLFKLSCIEHLAGIFLVIILFASFLITSDHFVLERFSGSVILPGNLIFGYLIPFILFLIGSIKKKVA